MKSGRPYRYGHTPEEPWATHLRDKVSEIISGASCPVLTVRTKAEHDASQDELVRLATRKATPKCCEQLRKSSLAEILSCWSQVKACLGGEF